MGSCGIYGEKRYVCRGWWGTLTEGDHFEDRGVEGRMVLKWMSQKLDGKTLTGFIWLMYKWRALFNTMMNLHVS
jgi:hypothetical protein